jgi:hypothetical protein
MCADTKTAHMKPDKQSQCQEGLMTSRGHMAVSVTFHISTLTVQNLPLGLHAPMTLCILAMMQLASHM